MQLPQYTQAESAGDIESVEIRARTRGRDRDREGVGISAHASTIVARMRAS